MFENILIKTLLNSCNNTIQYNTIQYNIILNFFNYIYLILLKALIDNLLWNF